MCIFSNSDVHVKKEHMKISIKQLRTIIREEVQKATNKKSRLSEGHARITQAEMNAWMSGDWGFVSEQDEDEFYQF